MSYVATGNLVVLLIAATSCWYTLARSTIRQYHDRLGTQERHRATSYAVSKAVGFAGPVPRGVHLLTACMHGQLIKVIVSHACSVLWDKGALE
jgi:hypothetical protein